MNASLLAVITVPLVTGVIGYVTNWTGVLMLFYPVHFKGIRAPWIRNVARVMPYKLRQIPGVMVGGIGWQGIVPSRAAKMGSLAVDSGIAKLGTPREFFNRLGPEQIAEQIVAGTRGDVRETVDRIMRREQPRLWRTLPGPVKELVFDRVEEQLPDVVNDVTNQVADHIDELVDVKLMVVRRFDPELANRVFLDMGKRELKFIQNFGFVFGFMLGIPVAVLMYFVDAWWLLPILGVIIGYITNWVALWMIYEPAEPEQVGPFRLQGLFVRRQPEVAGVYAQIVADEILTVSQFGRELLEGPQSDRTRRLIESAMRPAIDRALGPVRTPVRVAIGTGDYEAIRESFAAEPVKSMMTQLADPEFNRRQSATMREMIAERMRADAP